MREFIANSLEDLDKIAGELIDFAGDKRVLSFFGEMGAGKTTFIKSICQRLGVAQNVSSPTFSIVNEYADKTGNPVYHFDFYRIEKTREAVDIGCEEYFSGGCFCLVEWPEKILNLLPHPFVKIQIKVEESTRRFIFSYD